MEKLVSSFSLLKDLRLLLDGPTRFIVGRRLNSLDFAFLRRSFDVDVMNRAQLDSVVI